MNLLLFSAADRLDEQRIQVSGPRLRHLREVLATEPGDELRVGELGGLTGAARVLEISDKQAILAVELTQPPPPKLPLSLVLALPRPKALRRIVRTVAELGIGQLHLIHCYRVEKSYWQTPALQEDTLRDYCLQGLEQSRDTVLPGISCQRRFKPFVEDQLPQIMAGKRGLLAHPGDYPPCPRDLNTATVLLIGPEGGFIPYEIDKLEAAGCEPISIGPRILRVENALTALVGRLA